MIKEGEYPISDVALSLNVSRTSINRYIDKYQLRLGSVNRSGREIKTVFITPEFIERYFNQVDKQPTKQVQTGDNGQYKHQDNQAGNQWVHEKDLIIKALEVENEGLKKEIVRVDESNADMRRHNQMIEKTLQVNLLASAQKPIEYEPVQNTPTQAKETRSLYGRILDAFRK